MEYYVTTSESYTTHPITVSWLRKTVERIYGSEIADPAKDGVTAACGRFSTFSKHLFYLKSDMTEVFRCHTNKVEYPIKLHMRNEPAVGGM